MNTLLLYLKDKILIFICERKRNLEIYKILKLLVESSQCIRARIVTFNFDTHEVTTGMEYLEDTSMIMWKGISGIEDVIDDKFIYSLMNTPSKLRKINFDDIPENSTLREVHKFYGINVTKVAHVRTRNSGQIVTLLICNYAVDEMNLQPKDAISILYAIPKLRALM